MAFGSFSKLIIFSRLRFIRIFFLRRVRFGEVLDSEFVDVDKVFVVFEVFIMSSILKFFIGRRNIFRIDLLV